MEGNMNTGRRDPFTQPRRTEGVRRLMTEIAALADTIANAPRSIMPRGTVNVSREQLLAQLKTIEDLLPDAIKQAGRVLDDEANIRESARKDAERQTAKAREDAEKARADAKAQADKTLADSKKSAEEAARNEANAKNVASTIRAQAESDARALRERASQEAEGIRVQAEKQYGEIIAQARAEAAMIVQEAQRQANAAVSEENVYNMAVVAAKEIREDAAQEAAGMRKYCIGGLDRALLDADEYLSSIVASIRQERARLNSQG